MNIGDKVLDGHDFVEICSIIINGKCNVEIISPYNLGKKYVVHVSQLHTL